MLESTGVVSILIPLVKNIVLVMCGGSLGAATRYGVSLLAANAWGTHFPWGTLLVNLIGCFLIGLIFSLADRIWLVTPGVRLLLVTGFLGGMTTFSSYALETVSASLSGFALQPVLNIVLNNMGGLIFTLFGIWLGSPK